MKNSKLRSKHILAENTSAFAQSILTFEMSMRKSCIAKVENFQGISFVVRLNF